MKLGPFLESKQPLVYKTFSNAITNKRIAHAYLLSGEAGTPLKETAFFIAKSLLCDHPHPLADEECRTCLRVDHGNYPDVIFLDGEKGTIKKDDVSELVGDFSKTALEEKGIMIYIINLVENMTVEAVNSLLKFLEEPTPNTYAILTTENIAKVLPTIVSRTETMRLLLLPRKEVIAEALSAGVSQPDAELLSYFFNNGELIASEAASEEYAEAKTALEATLEGLKGTRAQSIYVFERTIAPAIVGKEAARYYFDMLALAFEDILALKEGRENKLSAYATLLGELAAKLPHPAESLLEIMKVRSQIDLNMSIPLLLDHLANYLNREK
jgi:DNA polymerase III subunit delta'